MICPFNPNTKAMVGTLDEEGYNGYLYDGDTVYFSKEPQVIDDVSENSQQTEDIVTNYTKLDDDAANHVAVLMAQHQAKEEGRSDQGVLHHSPHQLRAQCGG